jgi:hypothetical protein
MVFGPSVSAQPIVVDGAFDQGYGTGIALQR